MGRNEGPGLRRHDSQLKELDLSLVVRWALEKVRQASLEISNGSKIVGEVENRAVAFMVW
jgi:hypothetical protein